MYQISQITDSVQSLKDSLLPSSVSGNLNIGELDTVSLHEATDETIESDIDVMGTSFSDVYLHLHQHHI